MQFEESREAELRELVDRLDRLVPKEGAHLSVPGDPDGKTTVGSRLGYLRFGVEFLAAALRPQAATEAAPSRIEPDLDYLLTDGSRAPFDLCEVDESIVSRPPVRTRLGPLGQLASGVLAVAAFLLALLACALLARWIFG